MCCSLLQHILLLLSIVVHNAVTQAQARFVAFFSIPFHAESRLLYFPQLLLCYLTSDFSGLWKHLHHVPCWWRTLKH